MTEAAAIDPKMVGRAVDAASFASLSPPSPRHCRLALGVFVVSVLIFAVAAPSAQEPLPIVDAFIPAYQSALAVNDLVTAALLFGQFRILGLARLAVLGAGYIFTSLMAVAHALTFPGAFFETGLLGAGPQTTAWLFMFWHGGFPIFVIAFARMRSGPSATALERLPAGRAISAAMLAAALLVAAAVALASFGDPVLPQLMSGQETTWKLTAVVSVVLAISALAWGLMFVRRDLSTLDLWLGVVMQVSIFEVLLSSLLDAARFDLGFYVGRLYGLAASCFVLIVLIQDASARQKALVVVAGKLQIETKGLRHEIVAHIAALEKSNEALEASEREAQQLARNLTTLIESLPFGVTLVGRDFRHEAFNLRFLEIFKLPEGALRVGDSFESFIRHKTALGENGPDHIEWKLRTRAERSLPPAAERSETVRADGTTLESILIPLPDGSFVIAYFDITDRSKRLQQTIRAQKLEAVGSLTGGIAHDFNNMLTVMIGNLDFLRSHLRGDERGTGFVDDAEYAAKQAAGLTRRLLAFARKQTLDPRRIDVDAMLQGTMTLLRRTLGDSIDITWIGEPNLWPAYVDEGQCEAAIVNLAVNARDAMPGGGKLIIETRNKVLDRDYADAQVDVKPGDYVVIEVSDTGVGIPPENIGRIFEPFFTTKAEFRGTGLGLAMVYGFAKQSNGHISVYSEVGKGTTFRLYLPRAAGDGGSAPSRAGEPQRGPVSGEGGAAILVVDDNPSVRNVTIKQLQMLGYAVLSAGNGAEAVATFEANSSISLVLTDISMPGGMSGRDVVRELRGRRPDCRFLLMSGFPAAMIDEKTVDDTPVLRKPFTREELADLVRSVLSGARST